MANEKLSLNKAGKNKIEIIFFHSLIFKADMIRYKKVF